MAPLSEIVMVGGGVNEERARMLWIWKMEVGELEEGSSCLAWYDEGLNTRNSGNGTRKDDLSDFCARVWYDQPAN